MTVRVVTAAQAAARDRAAIDAGTPSRALMQRAGAAAAAEIVRHFQGRLGRGVAVFAGPGNNGGDAWVVAAALAAVGIDARVAEVADARTDDARAERDAARALIPRDEPSGAEEVVVDGVLGTGATGEPRGGAADAIRRIVALRARGASVVALDIPSGIDASSGKATLAVTADMTVTFGTMKRGALVARGRSGRIVVVDIGLGIHADLDDGAPELIDHRWVAARVPPIASDAHKGTRRRVAIVGGSSGMAGAAILAARAAMRSGVGMARVIVHPASIGAVQTSLHAALAREWPTDDDAIRETVCDWAHLLMVGPGLGRASGTRERLERLLTVWTGPVLLDADALTAFASDSAALGQLLRKRKAVITPHVVEFGRLADASSEEVLDRRFDIGADLARSLGCVVLLKGVPTVLHAPDGRCVVVAAGTPALATGGSGDLLAGIAATLAAQMDDPLEAAACAAWVHGRASELAGARECRPRADERSTTRRPVVRGITLDDVIDALPTVWAQRRTIGRPPVLAELPPVSEGDSEDDDRGDADRSR